MDTPSNRSSITADDAPCARTPSVARLAALGGIALEIMHDLNNFLCVAVSAAELLDDVVVPPEERETLANLRLALDRAQQLSVGLSSLGRARRAELTSHDMRTDVLQATSIVRALMPSKVTLREELPDDAVRGPLDPTELAQLLVNLCINAARAIGRDRPGAIWVRLTSRPSDGLEASAPTRGVIELSVSDDGPGMPDAVRSRLFERHFTTHASDGGSGLGGSIVHGLVTRVGGTVSVDSELGRGTTVRVLLPAVALVEERGA
ncbi:ATP-binding protein [Myxococcota bacterium]|nr:ATP-binding protein [Myxococcota bacterium]